MKISLELSKWETFLPIKANFQIPKFVEMFNSRIAKFMDIIGEQIYDELNQFIETQGGGERGIDRFPWNDKLRSREFPCALQAAIVWNVERRRTIGTKLRAPR